MNKRNIANTKVCKEKRSEDRGLQRYANNTGTEMRASHSWPAYDKCGTESVEEIKHILIKNTSASHESPTCTVEMYMNILQGAALYGNVIKFRGKMPRTRMSPERADPLCASLRNRNAGQHVRKTTVDGN